MTITLLDVADLNSITGSKNGHDAVIKGLSSCGRENLVIASVDVHESHISAIIRGNSLRRSSRSVWHGCERWKRMSAETDDTSELFGHFDHLDVGDHLGSLTISSEVNVV